MAVNKNTISVKYNDGNFSYNDGNGNDRSTVKCSSGDTITWQLDGASDLGAANLQIGLTPLNDGLGNPIGLINAGDTVTCNDVKKHGKTKYKYDVFVMDINGNPQHGDPMIEFNDGNLLIDGAGSGGAEKIEEIVKAAEKAWGEFSGQLRQILSQRNK